MYQGRGLVLSTMNTEGRGGCSTWFVISRFFCFFPFPEDGIAEENRKK